MPDNVKLKSSLEKFCAEITPDNAYDRQRQFSELWKKYVFENGYDEFAEKTLIDGYLCNSINYWKDVWKKQKQGDVFFKKLLSGKRIQSKEHGTLIVLLGTLSICINEFETAGKFIDEVLQLLGNVLPEESDFDLKEFEERFLKRIKERTPEENKIKFSSKNKNVLTFFKEIRKKYLDDNLKENAKVSRDKLDIVISLLSGSKKKKKKESLPKQNVGEKEETAASAEVQSQSEELQNLKKKYSALSEAKKALDKDLTKFQTLLRESRAEWNGKETNYVNQITALQNSLNNRRLEVEEKKAEIQALRIQTEQMSAELVQKESVIQDKNESIRILKGSRDDRYEKKMKSIQDRLAVYYGAFQDCRDQPMNDVLGRVMRNYLDKVFEIIKDNEMNLNQQ